MRSVIRTLEANIWPFHHSYGNICFDLAYFLPQPASVRLSLL